MLEKSYDRKYLSNVIGISVLATRYSLNEGQVNLAVRHFYFIRAVEQDFGGVVTPYPIQANYASDETVDRLVRKRGWKNLNMHNEMVRYALLIPDSVHKTYEKIEFGRLS